MRGPSLVSMRRALLVCVALVSVPRAAWPQGDPLGPEFRVNTYTPSDQIPSVRGLGQRRQLRRRLDRAPARTVRSLASSASATPAPAFPSAPSSASTPTPRTTNPFRPWPSDAAGNFVVVWHELRPGRLGLRRLRPALRQLRRAPRPRVPRQHLHHERPSRSVRGRRTPPATSSSSGRASARTAIGYGVFGQRYASSGAPLGPEFRVNTFTHERPVAVRPWPRTPPATSSSSGTSRGQDGSADGVFGQRYASSGAPLGPEFRVNTYTHELPEPSRPWPSDTAGNFVVVWHEPTARTARGYGVFGQRYASSGAPLGPEFRVNTYTDEPPRTFRPWPSDAAGNFVVVWDSRAQDGSADGVFGQRYASSARRSAPSSGSTPTPTSHQTLAGRGRGRRR